MKAPYPASELSNLATHSFVIDGVACECMEGFLQSLKFHDVDVQLDVCRMPGPVAQKFGAKGSDWKATQTLWWRGTSYLRSSDAYQELLDCAFAALVENAGFREALVASGTEELTHALGKHDPTQTVLTAAEFCLRLYALRARIVHAEYRPAPAQRRLRRRKTKPKEGEHRPTLRSLSAADRVARLNDSYVCTRELFEFLFSQNDRIESDFRALRRKVNVTLSSNDWMDAALEGGYAAGGRAMLNAVGEHILDVEVLFVADAAEVSAPRGSRARKSVGDSPDPAMDSG